MNALIAFLDGSHAVPFSSLTLTIRFVTEPQAKKLNETYRGQKGATNVLTFVYSPTETICADIVLCCAKVSREAREQHKQYIAHCCHLIIHGTLHALGFRHDTAQEAAVMEHAEAHILKTLGIANPYQAH